MLNTLLQKLQNCKKLNALLPQPTKHKCSHWVVICFCFKSSMETLKASSIVALMVVAMMFLDVDANLLGQ